jgi:beta-lactamase class D
MFQKSLLLVFIVFVFYACTPNNVKSDPAITKIMDSAGVTGTFALLENGSGQFTIANLNTYKDSAFAPQQTFFALPTLIALDKGYITHDASTWVNFDSIAYYQNLIAKIGRPAILKTIDSIHYGKGIVSADSTNYWSNGSIRITADEQLGFIKKMYFNQLPFQKRSQDLFKKLILKEDNSNYKLSYINAQDKNLNDAWWVGYVEENKHIYFFVLFTHQVKPSSTQDSHGTLLKNILTQQGFLKGVR